MKPIKKLMILGGGELQVPLVKTCKSIPDVDIYVLVTDRNPNAPAFDYADEYRVIDATDQDAILKYAKEKDIDGILTTSEIGLFTVAYVCKEMGLPGPSYTSAQISNNKHLMRERMKQAGMVIPKCLCIHSLEELMKESCELSFPLVIKPTDVSGSIGVMFVESKDTLWDSCRKALEFSNNSEVILEEYLIGKEYSVEILSQNGVHNVIAVTQKFLTDLPFFVEQRHIIPAAITENEYKDIEDYVKKFLSVCEIDNSASHTELRMTKNGPVIIETGARIGGDQITADLVPLATGVNMHENIARIALGLKLNIDNRINRYAGIQFIMNENYHKIINNIEKLRTKEGMVRVKVDDIGLDTAIEDNKTTNSRERHGYYIGVADTREDLLDLLCY